jgi:REP element-mobilizing transposase RayT
MSIEKTRRSQELRRRTDRQAEFGFANWGGKRRGAGRKPNGEKAGVSHAKRPELSERFPVHVTVKVVKGLPNLRGKECCGELKRAFGAGAQRFGFRLLHFSIQTNHVHLIAEAEDERALSRGMQGLSIRIAKGLNRLWRRSGKVFADRFHARILRTPREVKNALAYVLLNTNHHGVRYRDGIDPRSSAACFDDWKRGKTTSADSSAGDASLGFLGRARCWLLRVGWRRHGLLPLQL